MYSLLHHKLDCRKKRTWILGVFLCSLVAVCLNSVYQYFFAGITSEKLCLYRTGIFFLFLYFVYLHFVFKAEDLYRFIYCHRFQLALILFVFCILMKFQGSSIGMWNHYVLSSGDPSEYQYPIIGVSRPIRSDEWLVFTPLAMSQNYNHYAITNDIACAWPTNMLTTYNQPVWDITAIAKPFYWGYLLFGSDIGLSWFWCGRLIVLFVVTFEMFMLIAHKNKLFSLAAAFLITFAAFVQWWFAINFLVEMLVYGQLALLMIYRFLNTDRAMTKVICTAVFTVCALGYLFALYPAWMIPLFYVFLMLAVWILTENFQNSCRSLKELVYPLASLMVIGIIAAIWFINSKEAIMTTMNTVYPGARVYTGGDGIARMLFYINDLILPYANVGNSCEAAMACGFFPFTEMIVAFYLIRTRNKDKFLTLLLCLDGLFLFYLIVGVPEVIAKITLMYLTSQRIVPIICLIEIMLYIRLLSLTDDAVFTEKKNNRIMLLVLSAFSVVIVVVGKNLIPPELNPDTGLHWWYLFLVMLLMCGFCLVFFISRSQRVKRIFAYAAILLSVINGAFVNPLMRTTDAIYDKPLAQALQSIQKENPGTWISTSWIHANFLIANGVPTINSTNIIPTMERWGMLDESGKYADVYNRYAHIIVDFTGGETVFEQAASPDQMILHINFEDLKKLGVTYIHTDINQKFPSEEFYDALTQIYSDGSAVIYKLA